MTLRVLAPLARHTERTPCAQRAPYDVKVHLITLPSNIHSYLLLHILTKPHSPSRHVASFAQFHRPGSPRSYQHALCPLVSMHAGLFSRAAALVRRRNARAVTPVVGHPLPQPLRLRPGAVPVAGDRRVDPPHRALRAIPNRSHSPHVSFSGQRNRLKHCALGLPNRSS